MEILHHELLHGVPKSLDQPLGQTEMELANGVGVIDGDLFNWATTEHEFDAAPPRGESRAVSDHARRDLLEMRPWRCSGGELLRARHRLGHRDASTTLRNYAHGLPLEDGNVADDIDLMLGAPPVSDALATGESPEQS